MAFTQVTVVGTYRTASGGNATGAVVFTPVVAMRNNGIVVAAPTHASIVNGSISVSLAATDDASTVPTGVTYRVQEFIDNTPGPRVYYIPIPRTATTIDLDDVQTAELAPVTYQYALVDHSHPDGGPGEGGVTDHGALDGLGDDDHPQYVPKAMVDAKGDLVVGSADNTVSRLPVGPNGHILKANSVAPFGVEWGPLSSTGDGGLVDQHYVDVKDYGALGDYVVSTGVGTDDTAAIQAAIDSTVLGGANEGRTVLLTPGRYKTTAPIVMRQSTALVGVHLLRTKAGSAVQGSTYSSSIEFLGATGENCIQAVGTTSTSVSRVLIERFTIIDRRTSPTGGHGIYLEKVVNQTVVRNLDIYGFPTGSSIRVTAQSGNTSDCVTIEDIWPLGAQYGVNVDRIDNTCFITDIKIDSASGAPLIAAVRVSNINGVVMITGVKHENSSTTAATILLDTLYNSTMVTGVVSRVGTGGPVVRIIGGNAGSGVTLRGLQRQNSGALVEVTGSTQDKTITGTRLPFWVGGADGIHLNSARIYSTLTAGTENDIMVNGRFNASDTTLAFPGKLNVKPDSTSQVGLAITAPASYANHYMRIYDSANSTVLLVDSTGNTGVRDLNAAALTATGAFTTSKRITVADTNYTCLATDYIIALTSLSAPRTITLPAPVAGKRIIVKDEAGAAGTHNITVARAGSPAVIDGATTLAINQNYGQLELYSNGTTWFTNRAFLATAAGYTDEQVDDRVAALLVAGTGIGLAYNDAANALTISNTSGGGGAAAPDVQVFTADGVWTKPSGVTTVRVVAVGGGGGGGSGRRGAAASLRTGGGGGGGGAREETVMPASVLSATEAVTVGLGGPGGAAVTADSTNGNAGTGGGASTFGARSGYFLTTTITTGGGAGGTSTAGAAGGIRGLGGSFAGGDGGASGGGGGFNAGVSTNSAAPGGGSGGGISAADATSGGGGGGRAIAATANPLSGSSAGANGANGTAAPTNSGRSVSAGTGGGSSITGNAGSGGNGGLYGTGGGGGGASLNGFSSGAGGNGADGIVIVISQ